MTVTGVTVRGTVAVVHLANVPAARTMAEVEEAARDAAYDAGLVPDPDGLVRWMAYGPTLNVLVPLYRSAA